MDNLDNNPSSSPLTQSFSWHTQRLGAPPPPSPKPHRIVREVLESSVASKRALLHPKDLVAHNVALLVGGLVVDHGEFAAYGVFERVLWLAQHLVLCQIEHRKLASHGKVLERQRRMAQAAREELQWRLADQALLLWDTQLVAEESRKREKEAMRQLRIMEEQFKRDLASAQHDAVAAGQEIRSLKEAAIASAEKSKQDAENYKHRIQALENAARTSAEDVSREAAKTRERTSSLENAVKRHTEEARQAREDLERAIMERQNSLREQERRLKAETVKCIEDTRAEAMADAQKAHLERVVSGILLLLALHLTPNN